jgi:hypothetical protein
VRLFKLLLIPAAVLLSVAVATPVLAHHFTNVAVTISCGTGDNAGKVCIDVTGTIAKGNDARTIEFDLFDSANKTKALDKITITLPANKTGSDMAFDSHLVCFKPQSSSIKEFTVVFEGSTNGDLTVTDSKGNVIEKGAAVGDIAACTQTSPSPSPSPSTSPSPSASASANTTTTLAQTGGFDYRFPLIGLTLLVVGATLFLVSASRGRSASK